MILSIQQESIAKGNRDVDLRIAADQYRQNQDAAIDEHQQTQYVAYLHEISDLLLNNNFTLNRQILTGIVRPKTLTLLRQLDPIRKSYLLRFLHESRLLSRLSHSLLHLNDADFNYIQIGVKRNHINMRYVFFSGIQLENASLNYISFGNSDFSGARLYRTSFEGVNCEYCNFHLANLQESRFNIVTLFKSDFTNANLRNASIPEDQVSDLIFNYSIFFIILPNVSIIDGQSRIDYWSNIT